MPPVRTSRQAYKRHAYSGPRKSLKRVRGGLRKFYNEESRLKVWRCKEKKKKPTNEEVVTVTQNTQPSTYTRVKSKIRLEVTYSAPSTSISTVTAETVVGQSSFVEVVQNVSEIEMLIVKLEPPEYYKQHTQGDSSTSNRLTEELNESGLLGEAEVRVEKIEIGEEGFS